MRKIHLAALAAVAAVIIGCGTTSTGTTDDIPADVPTTAPAASEPTTATPKPTKPTATKTTPPVSQEQANATSSAERYLSNQYFSRKELIEQLKYEGYPAKAATAAVDSLHVDWKGQAAGSAKSYLSNQSFSRKGLIGQLEFEGFTPDQAAYGVEQAGL